MNNAGVIVFGDLGHSPRMQNHALSLATLDEIETVYFVGYQGSTLPKSILENPKIEVVYISTWLIDKLKKLPKLLYLVYVVLRILIQILQTIWILIRLPNIRFWFYQNPPCVPGLFGLLLVRLFRRRSRIILDWHNYAFSILQVSRVNRVLVKIAKFYEKRMGKLCDYHLGVSKNMGNDLSNNWGVRNPFVLYDKATTKFRRLNADERSRLFQKIWGDENKFIEDQKENKIEKQNRDMILFSSTSFTEDEDFNGVVNALKKVDKMIDDSNIKNPSGIHLVVTGKGGAKEEFERKFEECNQTLNHVYMETMWLEIEDYPKLVGSADLGIGVHFSSSGFDLPMKVVDMFSAQLGGLAIKYPSINELVKENKNGKIFTDDDELAHQIYTIYQDFKSGESAILKKYRDNLKNFASESWEHHWNKVVYDRIIKRHV